MTFYDVLEVRTDASPDDLRAAYRALAKKHHPDRGGSAKKMAALNEAYGVLYDPELRRDYDRSLVRERAPRRPATTRVTRASPQPARSPFEELLARMAAAALTELDVAVSERYAHLPENRRPPTLREILDATEDPGPPRPPRRARGTNTAH